MLAFPSEVRATPAICPEDPWKSRKENKCSGKTCPLHFGPQLGLLRDQLFRQFVYPNLAVAVSSRQKSRFAWDESRCFHATAIVAGCIYRDMGQNLEAGNQYLYRGFENEPSQLSTTVLQVDKDLRALTKGRYDREKSH